MSQVKTLEQILKIVSESKDSKEFADKMVATEGGPLTKLGNLANILKEMEVHIENGTRPEAPAETRVEDSEMPEELQQLLSEVFGQSIQQDEDDVCPGCGEAHEEATLLNLPIGSRGLIRNADELDFEEFRILDRTTKFVIIDLPERQEEGMDEFDTAITLHISEIDDVTIKPRSPLAGKENSVVELTEFLEAIGDEVGYEANSLDLAQAITAAIKDGRLASFALTSD